MKIGFLFNLFAPKIEILKTNKMKKHDYINAFLDGYFSDKKVKFGAEYYSMLNEATDIAKKKWKHYKKLKKITKT
jgi:hypothetical protein